nr:MAG TPA: hypothetical protein [Caudoviricetes sp.]
MRRGRWQEKPLNVRFRESLKRPIYKEKSMHF